MSQYPGALDGAQQLFDVRNGWTAALTASISPSAVDIPLSRVDGLQAQDGVLSIDDEVIRYDFIDGLTLRGCTRGFDNTVAAAHSATAKVEMRTVAAHHNALAAAIQAIQAYLGTNALPTASVTQLLEQRAPLQMARAGTDWSFTHDTGRLMMVECWVIDGSSYVQVPATVRQQLTAAGVPAMVQVTLAEARSGYLVAR